jgi:hypothetical protein
MVQNNKVLTVSYGTFSCTLEGFEDSFDTMKAIAEYFRDLAADDRYFGAEPPQPDADMLAHIAQREISRQVEARQSAEGIHLRAASATLPAAAAIADDPAEAPAAPEAEAVPEPVAEAAPAPTPEPAPEPTPTPVKAEAAPAPQPQAEAWPEPSPDFAHPPTPIVEPVAEAEDDTAPQPEMAEDVARDEEEAEDHIEEVIAADAAPAEPEVEAEPDTPEIAAQDEDEDDSPLFEAELVPDEDNIVPAADSIAAKLQRIRAVVTGRDLHTDDAEYSEDEHADAFVNRAAQDISEALNEDDSLESAFAQAEEYDEDYEDDGNDEILAALKRVDQMSEQGDTAKAKDHQDVAEDMPEPVMTRDEAASEDTEARPQVAAEDGEEEEDLDITELDFEFNSEISYEEEVEDEVSTDDVPRLLKVKRADMEEALASGLLETVEEDTGQDSSLSDEEEADLQAELDAVKADLTGAYEEDQDFAHDDMDDDYDDEDDGENLFQDEEEAAAARRMAPAPETDEDDVSRLMAAADEKLEDPETTTSRDTYNQLRAAVAAAEAEKSVGGDIADPSDTDAYRDDLADVVRPRRPAASSGRDKRPEAAADRPAPLKLVAEQRVDTDTPSKPRGPVRPRRIATELQDVSSGEPSGDSKFAAYAAEVGAVELSQLLEAAAAYLSFVEGHEQFSRPQLMNKLRQLDTPAFNREDGLRSFGQLLREGKIEKTGGGRFTASGDIGFQPDEREAG